MNPSWERSLRSFLVATLLVGGIVLLAGARVLEDLPDSLGPAVAAAIWTLLLAGIVLAGEGRGTPWPIPSAAILLSVLSAIAWAHFDPLGHLVLSGLAPGVALLAGGGVLRRRPWSWPVAFASVVGFGPLVVSVAPLPPAAVLAASVVFLADTAVLLALHGAFFEKPSPRA